MTAEYRFEDNQFTFYLKGRRMFSTKEVAVLYDSQEYVLLKHGPPADVQAAFALMHRSYGLSPLFHAQADSLRLVQGVFPVDQLNMLLASSTYLKAFCMERMDDALRNAQLAIAAVRYAKSTPRG